MEATKKRKKKRLECERLQSFAITHDYQNKSLEEKYVLELLYNAGRSKMFGKCKALGVPISVTL